MAGLGLFKRLLGGAPSSERRRGERRNARKGTRVLVIDDSSTIQAVLAKMLGQNGYTVLRAMDGEAGLAAARNEAPDLVFLDIVMPGMSGFEVLRQLRRDEATRALPIIMISGNMQATEQFYVQRFGADDFMKKPFGRIEVFARIGALVDAGRIAGEDPGAEAEAILGDLGLSQEELDAIPDVAMPDPRDMTPTGDTPPVPASDLASAPTGSPAAGTAAPAMAPWSDRGPVAGDDAAAVSQAAHLSVNGTAAIEDVPGEPVAATVAAGADPGDDDVPSGRPGPRSAASLDPTARPPAPAEGGSATESSTPAR